MTAGPVAVDQRVIAAMNRPAILPKSHYFMEVLEEECEKLRTIFGTKSLVTIVPGSGRVGLESAVVSVLERGQRTVHLVNGTFSGWTATIAQRAGAETTVVQGAWGGPIDLETVERTLRETRPALVTMVHSETSTGALYSLEEVGRMSHECGALFMVDAISSIGTMPFAMDAMGVDLAVCTSNKGLASLNGLSLVGVSEGAYRAMADRKTTCQSFCLDLKRWKDMFFEAKTSRGYPVPPSTHLVYALQEATRQALEEGLEARWERHRQFAEATRRATEAVRLQLFPDRKLTGNCVTVVRVPEGLEEGKILRGMDKRGILISGTAGGPAGTHLLRLSHQGVQASDEMMIPTLAALEQTLRSLGYPAERGAMVAAFQASREG